MLEISTAISSFSALKEAAHLLVDARDAKVLAAAKLEFMERLSEAQMKLLEVIGIATEQAAALGSATERVRRLEAEQGERERYVLQEVTPGWGVFAYRLRPASELKERSDEPVHFLCQPCFDAGRKVVMSLSGSKTLLMCAHDKAHYLRIGSSAESEIRVGRRGSDWLDGY